MRRSSRGGAIVVLIMVAVGGCAPVSQSGPAPRPETSPVVQPAPGLSANPDPARYAAQVRAHATEAGIEPVLLMSIIYNENYKPHDPGLERSWQKIDSNAAFGIANMHKAAFDDVKKNRPLANRDWQELPDDPDLAITAAAWYLHDLAAQLPKAKPGAPYTRDELLALGYNAGPATMKAAARGTTPPASAQSYVDNLRANRPTAEKALGGA